MSRWFGARLVRMSALAATLALSASVSVLDGHAASTSLNWGRSGTTVSPPGRELAAMAFDSVRGKTVMFGGDAVANFNTFPPPPYFADTWEWDGANWVQRTPSVSPPGLAGAAMAFDSGRGVSVLFGGSTTPGSTSGATWEWDGNTWTQRSPAISPSPRALTAMAYDSARGRMVLFGGDAPGAAGQTWEFDGADWMQRFPATTPTARIGDVMAFDSTRNVTVMFGGHNDNGRLNDTWEWDGNNWTQRQSTSVPYPRQFTSMAFDSRLGKTILFGGDHLRPLALGPVNDTWQWDGSQWTEDWTDAAPGARLGESMAYDSARDRMVMFGGTDGGTPRQFYVDTWELGTDIVTPAGIPDAAFLNASAFPVQPYGTTSPPAYALLTSKGTGPLHITSMNMTGDFAIASTDCPLAPDPLAAGMLCTVAVSFTPTATGTRVGTLTVIDDGSGGSQQIGFSATSTPIGTTLAVAQASAGYGGTATISATLSALGAPVAGADISFTLPNGATATTPTDSHGTAQWVGAGLTGVHAGFYFSGIHASYAGDANHLASSSYAALAISQFGSLTFSGSFYVSDTTGPIVAVTVDQRSPASDPQFVDFSSLPVLVQFDIGGPGGPIETSGFVADASDWASTGHGVATATLPALPDGAYTVTARFAPTYYPLPGMEFVTGDDARAAIVSSPVQKGFVSGGGAIASDPSANTADTHGYFAMQLKPGRTIQGNLLYTFRANMDVGGGTLRDVDVVVTSADVTSLAGNQQTASASGHFSAAFIDSATGANYPSLAFTGGTFTLSVSDGGTKTTDGFALVLQRPDGTIFHTTAPLNSHGDAPLVPVVLGDIVCNL